MSLRRLAVAIPLVLTTDRPPEAEWGLGWESGAERAADDQLDDLVVGHLGKGEGAGILAVAQDGQPVAEHPHFGNPVRDEDDRGARGFQICDDAAEPIDVPSGKTRSRLVKKKDLRLAKYCPGDFDLLADAQIHAADFTARIDVAKADAGKMLRYQVPSMAIPELAGEPGRCVGQQHILRDRQIGN